MLKKIQQYLLLHRPLLWNIKIVPVLATTLIINLLFFAVGYLVTSFDDLTSYYSYSDYSNYPLLLFFSFLLIVVILILWLVHYTRHNAFREFYPKRAVALYGEWILIFVILVSIFIMPFSYVQGARMKVKTLMTKEEILRNVEIINLIGALIPTDKSNYFSEFPKGYAKNENGELVKIQTVENEDEPVTVEKSTIETLNYGRNYYSVSDEGIDSLKLTFKDFPHFAPLSLLNQNFAYISGISIHTLEGGKYHDNWLKMKDEAEVEKWLLNEEKDKIRRLIDDFLMLAKECRLSASLTTDQWLALIYNPPTYPVGDFNLIQNGVPYNRTSVSEPKNFVPYWELRRACENIFNAHYDDESGISLLVIVCLAGCVSLLVFSFRCTSGKSWLIAIVAAVVLWIIYGLVSVLITIMSSGGDKGIIFFLLFFWIALFACEMIYLLRLNKNTAAKKYSGVVVNHVLWLLPAVPMILLGCYIVYLDEYYSWEAHRGITDWIDDHMMQIIWANVILTFVTVWLLVRFVIRRWKSLPEE